MCTLTISEVKNNKLNFILVRYINKIIIIGLLFYS